MLRRHMRIRPVRRDLYSEYRAVLTTFTAFDIRQRHIASAEPSLRQRRFLLEFNLNDGEIP